MSDTLEGDEWKSSEVPIITDRPLTRPERQEKINRLYATRKMSLARWQQLSNLLSDPVHWEEANV